VIIGNGQRVAVGDGILTAEENAEFILVDAA